MIHIITKVSLLSSHLALPREEHLDAVMHFLTCSGQRYNSRLVYDPSYPEKDCSIFKKCDWPDPEPKSREVDICMFVDNDHTCSSCRSRSSFLMYVNTVLEQWLSKKQ